MQLTLNPDFLGFRCTRCGAEWAPARVEYTCPRDGANLDAVYDYAAIARRASPAAAAGDADRSAWHYRAFLPLAPETPGDPAPLWSLGWTPLYRATRLERHFGVRAVWLKDDTRLPSSSFKDRASAMVVAQALHTGVTTICAASTGNAASSLATLCAGTGIQPVILVPESTPEGKLAQILVHGARVYAVRGSYDDAFELAGQASRAYGWYNRNTGANPYTREGKKTAAFEIAEQLAFKAPDAVVVPVGDGNIISGLHKGFRDLLAAGWIDRMPRLVGVTASLAPALYRAWQAGGESITPAPSTTIASGISADLPRDGVMALRAARQTGGLLVEATDEEMLEAMLALAREAAVFVEPASAAVYAGLGKARAFGAIRDGDTVVLQLTGSGLKDVKSALRAVAGGAVHIEGRLEEIHES